MRCDAVVRNAMFDLTFDIRVSFTEHVSFHDMVRYVKDENHWKSGREKIRVNMPVATVFIFQQLPFHFHQSDKGVYTCTKRS